MHYKSKQKLRSAIKLYLVEPETGKAVHIKIQLPTREFAQFDLNQPLPPAATYFSLANGGFNYDPKYDTPMTHYSASDTKDILSNSIGYRNNNTKAISDLIDLINSMSPDI